MRRRSLYATAMPIAAIIYVIVCVASGWRGQVVLIGALVLALVSVSIGAAQTPRGRVRNRRRNRKNL